MANESNYKKIDEVWKSHRNDICSTNGEVIVHWVANKYAWMLPAKTLVGSRKDAERAAKYIEEKRCKSSNWKVINKKVFY